MTDAGLRDLFQTAAPEPGRQDPAAVDRAWRDGTRRRTASRAAVVGSVAATAAVVVGLAVLNGPVAEVAPAPAPGGPTPKTSSSTEESVPVAERSGEYDGAPLWWSPTVVEESSLPPMSVASLPPVIDLGDASRGPVDEPVSALFWGWEGQVFVLTASQRVVELDTSRLEPVTDEGGNSGSPVSSYSLSADGRRAFFVQVSSVEVLDLVSGEWTSIDTPDWRAEGARWFMDGIWVPDQLGENVGGTVYPLTGGGGTPADVDWVEDVARPGEGTWGPVVTDGASTAQAVFLRGGVSGGRVSNPQAIVVERGADRLVLALDYGGTDEGIRPKGCCVALGWLDRGTVLFVSTGSKGQRVLAWDAGTEDVYLVSEIVGRGSLFAVAGLP